MNLQHEFDRQFQELHEALVKDYEEQVQQWKKQVAQQRERLQADEKEMRASLKDSGIDLDLLDRRAKREEEDFKAYLKQVRPGLVNRPSRRVTDFKERALEAAVLNDHPHPRFPPYATSLMAHDKSYLEGIEGERGNPWIFPTDPGQIKVKDTSTGDGWGCWAVAAGPPPTFNVWFYFIPDRTALWELTAVIVFHGFYILRSHDGLFTCKQAEVHTKVKMNAFQYYWKGSKTFDLIDIKKGNIETSANYDLTRFLDYQISLKAGDPVVALAQVSIDAFADGGGSYAEINFSDGSANYIEPLFLSTTVL